MTFSRRRLLIRLSSPLKVDVQRDKKIRSTFSSLKFLYPLLTPFLIPFPTSIPRVCKVYQTNEFDASLFLRSHARVLTRINILSSYTFDIPGSALIDISVYTRVQAS